MAKSAKLTKMLKKFIGRQSKINQRVTIIAIIGVVGVGTLFFAQAAGFSVSVQPENGTLQGNASKASDSTASGGSLVTFGGGSAVSLNLPRVPWEGGPAYWSKYSKAAEGGWTNPSFFPIGNWMTNAFYQSDIDKDKAVGINVYVSKGGAGESRAMRLQSSKLLRDNNMFSIPDGREIDSAGSEAVGWKLIDEPAQHCPGDAGCILRLLKEVHDEVRAESPNDGRFTYTNFTGDSVLPVQIRWDSAQDEMNKYNGLVSTDVYWYTFTFPCGMGGGNSWDYGSGPANPHGLGWNDLSYAECHRSANYGYNVNQTQMLSAGGEGLAPKVPVWNFVENSYPSDGNSMAYAIQPNELKGAVMNSIINEARGIIYFDKNMSGGKGPNEPCGGDEPFRGCNNAYGLAVRAAATQVNSQVKQLAPVINTQSYQWNFNSSLDTMLKAQGNSFYVFAMPAGVKGGAATGTHTLTLPTGMPTNGTAEVMFENRSVPITGGKITDNFAAEYTYHIYKITP